MMSLSLYIYKEKRVRIRWMTGILIGLMLALAAPSARADEFYCETMSVEGQAYVTDADGRRPVKEGDLLKPDDAIEVEADSRLDLAYDKDWNNVARLEAGTKAQIRSVYPAVVRLEHGGIFATLKSLPTDSTFEVETPTAVAAVRGTEYRTTADEDGQTEVYNFSDSQVSVYGVDASGHRMGEPMVLANSEKTGIPMRGRPPVAPVKMNDRERQAGEAIRTRLHDRVNNLRALGKVGKIQGVDQLNRAGQRGPDGQNRPMNGNRPGPAQPNGQFAPGEPNERQGPPQGPNPPPPGQGRPGMGGNPGQPQPQGQPPKQGGPAPRGPARRR